MLGAGRLVDKLGTKQGFILAIIIWSLGAVTHAYAVPFGELSTNLLALAGIAAIPASVLGFMLARMILAIGEAGNFRRPLKPRPNISPNTSAHWRREYLIPALM